MLWQPSVKMDPNQKDTVRIEKLMKDIAENCTPAQVNFFADLSEIASRDRAPQEKYYAANASNVAASRQDIPTVGAADIQPFNVSQVN